MLFNNTYKNHIFKNETGFTIKAKALQSVAHFRSEFLLTDGVMSHPVI